MRSVVVALTLTKPVVTGQAPVTLERKNTPVISKLNPGTHEGHPRIGRKPAGGTVRVDRQRRTLALPSTDGSTSK